jgi:hypothetical protein
MAVRIEFFTITGTGDFDVVDEHTLDSAVAAFENEATQSDAPAGVVRCVGWLSASDDDEARFSGWCDAVDDDLGIGLLHQGLGEDSDLDANDIAFADEEPEASWFATLREAVEAAKGGRIGWRTNFDAADRDGPDEYPTASHRASGHD